MIRLQPELIPSSAWGINYRNYLKSKEWHNLSLRTRQKSNYTCIICGSKSSETHEKHKFDDINHIMTLKQLLPLCNLCHMCYHPALAQVKGIPIIHHLSQINNISEEEAKILIEKAWITWNERNKYNWNVKFR